MCLFSAQLFGFPHSALWLPTLSSLLSQNNQQRIDAILAGLLYNTNLKLYDCGVYLEHLTPMLCLWWVFTLMG